MLLEINKGIATVYLNEPDSLNALRKQLKEDLLNILGVIEKDPEIRVVILIGNGRSFCAGGDIKAMAEIDNPLEIKRNMDQSARIVETLRGMPQITIAAVHGYAAGAGFSLALASDLIVAEEGTKFVLSFKNVGLIPDLGLHYHLPKILGEWKAKEWIWNGAKISAEEGRSCGFVREVVPKGHAYEKARELAKEFMEGPIQSYIHSKMIINNFSSLRLEDVLRMENDVQTILRGSSDHKEGVSAFLEKRTPKFSGS
ncbi:enoyl-CoA hydratase/isomerase family protein [Aneurinibacillus terranovensis]|uniref:enoyl-CoA hydratase/isomerase family protein n=1 Tax=Aneurinibacillus terranovensis TaxID=278991 RepID=UPI00041D5F5F|nr:enoyl-CoA hydratase-related protein [Aneurinibacillus terranovensis]